MLWGGRGLIGWLVCGLCFIVSDWFKIYVGCVGRGLDRWMVGWIVLYLWLVLFVCGVWGRGLVGWLVGH